MNWLPFASYNLWIQFTPAVGQERWHCDMKRGFTKARKREPDVAALLGQDNTYQRIGHLAQRGVYEFHRDTLMLCRVNGVEKVAEILQLSQESDEVQYRQNIEYFAQIYPPNPSIACKYCSFNSICEFSALQIYT